MQVYNYDSVGHMLSNTHTSYHLSVISHILLSRPLVEIYELLPIETLSIRMLLMLLYHKSSLQMGVHIDLRVSLIYVNCLRDPCAASCSH